MKTIIKSLLIGGFFGTLLIGTAACAKNQKEAEFIDYANVIDVASDGTTVTIKSNMESVFTDNLSFSESELDILLHMKEEEKLARDVYTALYDKWGSTIFSRISEAEDNHMNAVILLLQNYGEEYTQIGAPGEFTNTDFLELYKQLTLKGSESVSEAYKIGALIEEMDIKDLTEYLSEVTNENIIMVFENLQKGSRNHLRAFNRQLVSLGLTYAPVYISQDDYNLIVNSPNEKGNQYQMNRNGCKGNKNGRN
ncbi:MAG: DUF2202 domain-containing protein [Bacteroidales bacterium]|nr:DUF2202 domain-containing protein [Bacteroidales bacterium]